MITVHMCLVAGSGYESKAISAVFIKVPDVKQPKPDHIDWSGVLKLE